MARVEEGRHNSAFQTASVPTKTFIRKIDKLTSLVESGFTKDEECCLVCGDTAYEEDNMIGFCDLCGLSVHRACYGLLVLDSTTDFTCNNCKAFSTQFSMNTLCALCGNAGGAQLPTSMLNDEFSEAFKYIEANQSLTLQRNLNLAQIIHEEHEFKKLTNLNAPMHDAKIPYDTRLRKGSIRSF